MTSYTTYFKRFQKYWKDKNEPEKLNVLYVNEDGNHKPQHERRWWEFGVIILRVSLSLYMPEVKDVVRIILGNSFR